MTPQVDEGPKIHLVDIQIRGNKTVSEETILLSIPIHAGQDVTRAQVEEALQRIYGLGYFHPPTASTQPVLGGERLIIHVVEYPVLKGVTLEGATLFPASELEKPFDAMKGRVINLKDVQEAIKNLEKRYADKGYVLARIVDLQVSPDGQLMLKIAEGTINEIQITGNDETQDYVIRREITLKPGDTYNFSRMQDDLRRVYNLNYFEDIGIKYEPASSDPTKVNVIVTVKEKQTGTFNLSAGWSNRDGPLGILSLRKDNLLGRSQSVSADLTISKNWAAELNYFNPWIDDNHTSFGASLYARRFFNYYASFLEERQGTALSFGQPLFGQDPVTAQWRGAWRLKLERISLKGAASEYTQPLDTVTGQPYVKGVGRDADLSTSVGYTVTFDSRDYILNPNTGWFNTAMVDQYVPGLGDLKMTRLQLDLNRYFPLWLGHTLAVGWKLGTMQTPFGGNIPPYERFYSIGNYMVRGWPEGLNLTNPASQGAAPGQAFAGDSFTLGSIEYRFPIVNILSGVVFGDTGLFWDQTQQNFGWERARSGYGVGVRLNTPLGPLRLDYGLKKWGEAGQIHFSIGQKF
ncbi:Outer membrane protein assembly factor BamA precursor [compost metagenome]